MMKLSLFPRVTVTQGREIDTSWKDFATGYLNTHHPQLTKAEGELYSGAVYESGNIKREDINVIGITAVVFDFDNKDCPISMPDDHLENLAGLTYAWHSTWSHTPEQPHFRIIIPLDRVVSPREWPAVFRGAMALVGNDPAIDRSCGDLSRAYWQPAYYPSNAGQEFAGFIDGDRLSADEMLELAGSQPDPVVVPFKAPPLPKTVPLAPPRHEGRNDALKAQVAACKSKGKGLDETIKEVIAYDKLTHAVPLFSDPHENRGGDAYNNAVRFVSSIWGSIDSRRIAQGLPAEIPGSLLPEPVKEFPVVWWSDRAVTLDTHDFVEGLLNDNTMSVIYGDSNVGKSFFILDLCLHVAMGRAWQGRDVEQGGVIYVAAEGGFLFQNRLEAFARHYNISDKDIPFAVVPCGIDMRSADADTNHLVELIKSAAQRINMPVKMVIIDTLARAMNGGNENSSEDMGALVIHTDRVRHETGAHVGFIHHCGKDAAKGARGHSSLRAATDTEIEIVKENGVMSVSAVKQRDMEQGHIMDFTLKSIELGKNRRGKPVTSCVILPAVSFGPAPNTKGLGKNQAQSLRVLEDLYESAFHEMERRGQPRSDAKIELSRFHTELAELGLLGKKEEFYKQQFYRIKEGLLERNIIRIDAGFVYVLVNSGSQTW